MNHPDRAGAVVRMASLLLAAMFVTAGAWASPPAPIDVVFVCQHGYAKSLVAAKLFERTAAAHGLDVRVHARGITPAPGVPAPLAERMRADGFDVVDFRPTALDQALASDADYLVRFGMPVPFPSPATQFDWDDVSALSQDYDKARDEIDQHVIALVERIRDERR